MPRSPAPNPSPRRAWPTCKWPNPVRPGDALRLVAEVIEVRRSEKRPTLGILRWRWRLFNQRELPVLDLEATSLFKLGA